MQNSNGIEDRRYKYQMWRSYVFGIIIYGEIVCKFLVFCYRRFYSVGSPDKKVFDFGRAWSVKKEKFVGLVGLVTRRIFAYLTRLEDAVIIWPKMIKNDNVFWNTLLIDSSSGSHKDLKSRCAQKVSGNFFYLKRSIVPSAHQ